MAPGQVAERYAADKVKGLEHPVVLKAPALELYISVREAKSDGHASRPLGATIVLASSDVVLTGRRSSTRNSEASLAR